MKNSEKKSDKKDIKGSCSETERPPQFPSDDSLEQRSGRDRRKGFDRRTDFDRRKSRDRRDKRKYANSS